jgi:hypothetical protein
VNTWSDNDIDLPYKTRRLAKKFLLRDKALETKAEELVENPKYKGVDIWDLNFISSSDDSDNDWKSEEEQQESEDDEEEKVFEDKEDAKP